MSHILFSLFQHCRWDNPIAKWGSLFFSIFMFSIIWFYVDKYQHTQQLVHQASNSSQNGDSAKKPASIKSSSGVQTRSQVAKQIAQSQIASGSSGEDATALAERRAKKRDLIMKMSAPDRIHESILSKKCKSLTIDEDPLQEEQLATARDSPSKAKDTVKVEEVKASIVASEIKKSTTQQNEPKQKSKKKQDKAVEKAVAKEEQKEAPKEEKKQAEVDVAKDTKLKASEVNQFGDWSVVTNKKQK